MAEVATGTVSIYAAQAHRFLATTRRKSTDGDYRKGSDVKTYLEQRAEEHAKLEKRILAQKELTGIDYNTVPVQILSKHKDFSQHALRVIEAINKMTSTQIEGINLNPSGRKS